MIIGCRNVAHAACSTIANGTKFPNEEKKKDKKERRTVNAPVGARAARSGNKWSPGLKHGPTRLTSIAATPLGLAGRERLGSKEPAVSWMAVSRIAVLQIV